MARSRSSEVKLPGDTEPEAQPESAPQEVDQVEPTPGVLRAADVDPFKIKRAVLTVDGWVCPATSPAPPARQ